MACSDACLATRAGAAWGAYRRCSKVPFSQSNAHLTLKGRHTLEIVFELLFKFPRNIARRSKQGARMQDLGCLPALYA